jgi:negative regulator of flagellin synthesis FlgM
MRIDNNNLLSNLNLYKNEAVEQKRDAAGTVKENKATTKGMDRVELSIPREQIDQLKKALAELPEVRPERVAALQENLSQGTYDVSGRMVAEKMLGR